MGLLRGPRRNADVPGKMKYQVQNDQYRDVYDQRDRKRNYSTNKGKHAKQWNLAFSIATFIALMILECFVFAVCGHIFYQLLSMGGTVSFIPTYGQFVQEFFWPDPKWWWLVSMGGPAGASYLMYFWLHRTALAQNVRNDNSDLNQYKGDSRMTQPEEMPHKYDIFPDAGMHSSVNPTALIGHMHITNQGLKKIDVTKRYDRDTIIKYDDGFQETAYKDDPILDEDGNVETKVLPVIDEKFSQDLYDSSNVGKDSGAQFDYNPRTLLYTTNPAQQLGKAKFKTVAEMINADWTMPEYEVQRPGGMYIVDTDPNNTMVLAMTRAGKGQTIIEPTIDMWLRSDKPANIAINDPKGELYRKYYFPAVRRGYDVVAFNLINPSRTNIYNPLGYAVDAARKGDTGKVTEFVNTIGDVFFPTDKADDPMWPNAANAAFKRSAFGLIDFYTEEDHELQDYAYKHSWSPAKLNRELDSLWGHVTLYNVYQMMTQLASKKSSDPDIIHLKNDDESEEKDYLTLFFDATNMLPLNSLRREAANQDNSLRAMAGSDKTIASVYGISLTAILFFADDKISRLTSGKPSQNFDISGLAFPRRIEVRLDQQYMDHHAMKQQRFKWTAFNDPDFTDQLGKEFDHEGEVNTEGWILYAFEGIFPKHHAYLKLDIIDRQTQQPMHTFYFKFTKGYLTSLDGGTRVKDEVSGGHIISNGTLIELLPKKSKKTGKIKFLPGSTGTVNVRRSLVESDDGEKREDRVPAIRQSSVHYTEKPKIIFFVTPPHLMTYAKIILILLNQMFNMQVDMAYTTKKNQKPLYETKYMLDEVGNLRSEGKGIPFLQTKESIGLGQSQQYTLILQTFQQLKDVYGAV